MDSKVDDLEAEYQKLRLGKDTRQSKKDDANQEVDLDSEASAEEPLDEEFVDDEDIEWNDDMTVEQATELKEEGNKLLHDRKLEESIEKYSKALKCKAAPSEARAVYYRNRAVAYKHLQKYEEAFKDSSRALKVKKDYKRARETRKEAAEKIGRWEIALKDAKELGALPSELKRLELQANAEKERKTAEAFGQLKEMGNSFLKTFGLSLDNFKSEKDPTTGAYNIQFNQKK